MRKWTIKKAECQRIDVFELWFWRRLLRVPWTARKSNQSILKKINLEYSFERLILKLMLQYFGHMMQRANSLKKTLMLGKTEGSFCTTKETISKVKRQPSEWEKIIANEATDKQLISKIYKQLLQLNFRKIKTQPKNGPKN